VEGPGVYILDLSALDAWVLVIAKVLEALLHNTLLNGMYVDMRNSVIAIKDT